MKTKLLLFYLSLSLHALAQIGGNLSVSPNVDESSPANRKILLALDAFLSKKDTASYQELLGYWDRIDFERFRTPYFFLMGMEKNGAGATAYKPSVMEILPIGNDRHIVKLSYISTSPANLFVKAVCNLIARYDKGNVLFSSYINLVDGKWREVVDAEARYIISPGRDSSYHEDIRRQREFNEYISDYLEVEKIPYTFYSATSVEEFFNLQGFQYHPMMYADSTGGIILNSTVISANNSEFYPHEIAHLYIRSRLPGITSYFDEGLATYLGGSGKTAYRDYLKKLRNGSMDDYDFLEVFQKDIFDKSLWKADMPITYVLAAIICDYGIDLLGKDAFFDLVNKKKDKRAIINGLSLDEARLDRTMKQFVNKKPQIQVANATNIGMNLLSRFSTSHMRNH